MKCWKKVGGSRVMRTIKSLVLTLRSASGQRFPEQSTSSLFKGRSAEESESGVIVVLSLFTGNWNRHFHVYLVVPREGSDQEEIELLDDDMEVDFIKGDTIDLSDIVREQIYLSLPMRSICKESCRGLCPVCGANLNESVLPVQEGRGSPGFFEIET